MTRAAVLGSPIAHSLSPVLHRAAYAALGLAGWTYERHECVEDGLAAFLARDFAGLSLTMPLKRVALDSADERSDLAVKTGGANTLVRLPGGGWSADNTDVHGIVQALAEAGITEVDRVVVLGGGATAASVLAAASLLGAERAALAVRTPARAAETAAVGPRFGLPTEVVPFAELESALEGADLVLSTLPGDAAAPYAALVAASKLPLFDAIYAPWPTALARAALAEGTTVANGFAMLLHQAVRQVTLMTGVADVPVAAMRAAGEAELARRAAAR
ncbi:shikimate dehydrogenase [Actinocorallia sp. A-T 12471]|uniref:shikimate dehydrogenase n=1 Tax=Actinocorallia sp. A-T 12471 TaxID=3089813 RepID=UPI0029CC85ED|nr:shikimate dehydrogenase [Actinocorallia sp. A-T 12471]MDX6740286.1 shikimate dehydrogenase [Actinocorallia sp. A-T 12471]